MWQRYIVPVHSLLCDHCMICRKGLTRQCSGGKQDLMLRRGDCFTVSSRAPLPAHWRDVSGVQYRVNREKSIQHKILQYGFRFTDAPGCDSSGPSWGWMHQMQLPLVNHLVNQKCLLSRLKIHPVAKEQLVLGRSLRQEKEKTRQRKRKSFQ